MDIVRRKYATADTVRFSLFNVNGIDEYLTALAAGDCQISIDGAALANNTPAIVNGAYVLTLSGASLTGKVIVVKVIDQTATKVFMDYTFVIETEGDALAQHPSITQTGDSYLNVNTALSGLTAPSTAGGLPIGSNLVGEDLIASTTVTAIEEVGTKLSNVLLDTNELQTNQGDWATATGFNTVAPDNDGIATIQAVTDNLNDITVQNIINGVTDGTFDLIEILNAIASATAADTTNGGLTQRDLANTKDRGSLTVISGNRTFGTRDLS